MGKRIWVFVIALGVVAAAAAGVGITTVSFADASPTPTDGDGDGGQAITESGLTSDALEVQALIFDGDILAQAGFAGNSGVSTNPEPGTGRLEIIAPARYVFALDALLAPYGDDAYVVRGTLAEVGFL